MNTRNIYGSPFDPEGVVTDSKARPERKTWRPAPEEWEAAELTDVRAKKKNENENDALGGGGGGSNAAT